MSKNTVINKLISGINTLIYITIIFIFSLNNDVNNPTKKN